MAMPICLRLLAHWVRAAASRTFCTAGKRSPMRMAMMAITTSNSMSVKARREDPRCFMVFPPEEVEPWNGLGPLPLLAHLEVVGVRHRFLDPLDGQIRRSRVGILRVDPGPRRGRSPPLPFPGLLRDDDHHLVPPGRSARPLGGLQFVISLLVDDPVGLVLRGIS